MKQKEEIRCVMRNRRGSRIDTDRFPKQVPKVQASGGRGGGGAGACSPWGNFSDFQLPKVPFSAFLSHSDRILARFQLGKFYFYQNIFIYKKSDRFS